MVKLTLDLRFKVKLPTLYDKLDRKGKWEVRQEYSRRQGGLCYYCKAPLSGMPTIAVMKRRLVRQYPPSFFKHSVHLHHNHITGLTIGATHARCNAVLFEYHGE